MALLKKVNFKGYDYEYWGYIEYSFSKIENKTFIKLCLFKNIETRQIDINNYIDNKCFLFDGNLSVKKCFEKIKLMEEFAGSEDLL